MEWTSTPQGVSLRWTQMEREGVILAPTLLDAFLTLGQRLSES